MRLVVRRCPAAKLDPNFERGATNLLNAMKAAICLFDIELSQMRSEIRVAYPNNQEVLGIFPVAAYNGGPRNVAKLYGVMKRMGVKPEDLRAPGSAAAGKASDLSVSLEGGRWRRPPRGDPEVQQRESVVHRKVPDHPWNVRSRGPAADRPPKLRDGVAVFTDDVALSSYPVFNCPATL